jgi:hypothetical protein
MDQSILPYCVIYQMDQSALNSIFFKSVETNITTVVTGVNNSYIATGVDDVIRHRYYSSF